MKYCAYNLDRPCDSGCSAFYKNEQTGCKGCQRIGYDFDWTLEPRRES